jgi:hypothetical protein
MIRMFSGFDDVVFSDKENLSHCNRRYRLFPTVEHDLSEPIGVVSHFFAVVQQVGADDLRPLIYCVMERTCDADLVSTFSGVKLSLLFADPAVVDDNKIEVNLRRVLLDRLEVLSRAVTVSLAGLRHEVVDQDFCRTRLADDASHLSNEKIRQDARVERAWTNRDDVGSANRFQRRGQWQTLFRFQPKSAYRNFRSGDLSLTVHQRSVVEFRD